MARLLILAGVILILIGAILNVAPWLLSWFGRLPGDIRYESDNTTIFIPLTSMILISLIATIVIHILRRLF